MSTAREEILAAVARHASSSEPTPPPPFRPAADADAAAEAADPEARFRAAAEASDAQVIRTRSMDSAMEEIVTLLRDAPDGASRPTIAIDGDPARIRALTAAGFDATDRATAAAHLAKARHTEGAPLGTDVYIAVADGAIAETGTLAFSPQSLDDRRLMALASHQIVIVALSQIFADAWAFEDGLGEGSPGDLLFVTGPSRTADIEKQIVLGAHGPSRLTIFVTD